MSCSNSSNVTTSCSCHSRNGFVIILVLYILLAIILGSSITW